MTASPFILIEAFHEIQERCGFLPREELERLSRDRRLPREALFSAATFYTNFRTDGPGARCELRVCTSLPCRLAGAGRVLEAARAVAAAAGPELCAVREFPCLGQCDGAPAALAGYDVIRRARRETLGAAVSGRPLAEPAGPLVRRPHPREERVILAGIEDGPSLAAYVARGGYRSLARALARPDPDALLGTLKASVLRGMGGAAFPTGLKVELVRKAKGQPKYVVVNADEGEPGTFKDRVILEGVPHRLLEGAWLAAHVISAAAVYVYVRDEYRPARAALLRALDEVRAAPPEGIDTATLTPVHVVRGAGSYVCGEETALLESLEGKRGEPRLKPPFPSDCGLFGKPTLINNVETLASVPPILQAAAAAGGAGAREPPKARTKLFSLSGAVARPGVYELPLGTPARVLIEECGGAGPPDRAVKAFFTAGLAAGFLPAAALDTPLDFAPIEKAGGALGCASIIVVPEGVCIVRVVEECLAFFAHESCGKCTPCRVGTAKMTEVLRSWRRIDREVNGDPTSRSSAGAADLALLEELAPAVVDASICGLGQFAPKPFADALRHFRAEVEAHALRRECPEGVCFREDGAAGSTGTTGPPAYP